MPPKDGVPVQMMVIPLQIKSSNDEILQKKNITMQNTSTFLALRFHIIEEFNIKTADFDFLLGTNNNIRLSAENEEEYSLSVLG